MVQKSKDMHFPIYFNKYKLQISGEKMHGSNHKGLKFAVCKTKHKDEKPNQNRINKLTMIFLLIASNKNKASPKYRKINLFEK